MSRLSDLKPFLFNAAIEIILKILQEELLCMLGLSLQR